MPYAVFHKQLGDLVLLEPALRRMREHHGGSVGLLTRGGHRALAGLIEGVRVVRGLPVAPARHLYALDPLNKTALRSLLAPALRKVCVLPERREMPWFTRLVYSTVRVPGLGKEYIAEYFWRHVIESAPADAFEPPRLQRPPDAWRPEGFPQAPYVLVNPTAGWPKKNWLPERWGEVLAMLDAEGLPPAAVSSGPQPWQQEHAAAVVSLGGLSRLCGATTLEGFLWLCSRARLVLTVDGAASHLAAAFGIPCLTLFGPTEMAHWHRPGRRSVALQADRSADGVRRLKNLHATPVAEAALALWQATR